MIDQLEKIDVNNNKQWILCRGNDSSKPLVLFVHGGPGSPLMMFSRAFDEIFLKDFVVVHWDQRRSGKSFSGDVPVSSVTLENIVNDGLVVASYLKEKFNRSQIILVGHSWGTIVASHMVKASPYTFSSYVSVGTVVDMVVADNIKFEFLQKELMKEKDNAIHKDFNGIGNPPFRTFNQAILVSKLIMKYGGAFRAFTPNDINDAVQKTKEYSNAELEMQAKAMKDVFEALRDFLSEYRAATAIHSIEVPVVFVQGAYDLLTPASLTKSFVNGLKAPNGKKFVSFESSAHFPMYEEPEKFLEVLKDAQSKCF